MITTINQTPVKQALAADYLQLTKPRIVLLLIFTTVTAMLIAAQGTPLNPLTLVATIAGGSLSAAGASTLNQYLERDLDAQMSRTKNRPLPAGRIAPLNALLFGLGLIGWSTLMLGLLVNWLTALLALGGAVYYVVIYTLLLKPNTELNILIGGGAGAMPVLVGWAAATGQLAPQAFVLFAIIFFWTPPHSWALSILIDADYERGNVPMLPVKLGAEMTRWQIVWYSLLLVILTLLPVPLGMLSLAYFAVAVLLGTGLLYRALRLLDVATKLSARQMYKYSSSYLAMLFLAMIVDRLLYK
ncbi:MAG: heme o synthase [Aggregatilineales bacterium]